MVKLFWLNCLILYPVRFADLKRPSFGEQICIGAPLHPHVGALEKNCSHISLVCPAWKKYHPHADHGINMKRPPQRLIEGPSHPGEPYLKPTGSERTAHVQALAPSVSQLGRWMLLGPGPLDWKRSADWNGQRALWARMILDPTGLHTFVLMGHESIQSR